MLVDAHVHVLPDRVRAELDAVAAADPWFGACHARPGAAVESPDGLVAAMDGMNVDVAVCFTWPFADPALCAEANDWLAAQVRRHPGRLIGFGVVQPADPGAAEEALRCARLGLRGIGELNADAQGWALEDTDAVTPLARACVEAGLPWNLHCSEPVGHAYPGKGTATPDRIAALADRHPDLQLVCAHLGGGLPLYADMPEVRALCRRLWFDTAAVPFLYDPTVYASVVGLIGADRLLLGSDHPLLGVGRYLDALSASGLDGNALEAIRGGTATALLGL